jgi:hypothetical protein
VKVQSKYRKTETASFLQLAIRGTTGALLVSSVSRMAQATNLFAVSTNRGVALHVCQQQELTRNWSLDLMRTASAICR